MSDHEHSHHHGHHHEHHGHSHGNHGDHGHASAVNKEFWDDQAAVYDQKHQKLSKRLNEELLARLDFVGIDWINDDDDEDDDEKEPKKQVRLLDYACGTGAVSRTLAPYTTQCVGIDISEGMVNRYNMLAANQGLSPNEMQAHLGDLARADDPSPASFTGPEFHDFDVAAIGGGLHHFGDPALALVRLGERLRKGGAIVVWDFAAHGDRSSGGHEGQHTVMHHGFTEERMREMFEAAGCGGDFKLDDIGGGVTIDSQGGELKRNMFFARGTKV